MARNSWSWVVVEAIYRLIASGDLGPRRRE